MQQVGVDAERRLAALVLGDGDLVLFGEVEQGLAALEIPLAPGGDDVDVGLQRIVAEFEAHLVIALCRWRHDRPRRRPTCRAISIWRLAIRGRAMEVPSRYCPSYTVLARNMGKTKSRTNSSRRSSTKMFSGFTPISSAFSRAGPKLLALAEVGGEGDHLGLILGLQPFQDDRGVQAPGIGEHHLLDALGGVGLSASIGAVLSDGGRGVSGGALGFAGRGGQPEPQLTARLQTRSGTAPYSPPHRAAIPTVSLMNQGEIIMTTFKTIMLAAMGVAIAGSALATTANAETYFQATHPARAEINHRLGGAEPPHQHGATPRRDQRPPRPLSASPGSYDPPRGADRRPLRPQPRHPRRGPGP